MADPEQDPRADTGATTEQDVFLWFREYLGRAPIDMAEAEGWGRFGMPRVVVENEIYNSPEAVAYRARRAEEDRRRGEKEKPAPTPPGANPNAGKPPPIIEGIAGTIVGAIIDQLAPSLRVIREIDAKLGGTLARDVAGAVKAVTDVGGKITQELATSVGQLIPDAIALAGLQLENARQMLGAWAESAATIGDVTGGVQAALEARKNDLGGWVSRWVGSAFGGGLTAVLELLEGEERGAVDALLEQVLSAGVLPPAQADLVGRIRAREAPLAGILLIPLALAALLPFAQGLIQPGVSRAEQGAWERDPALPLSLEASARAAASHLISDADAHAQALRAGYTPELAQLAVELARTRPGAADLIAARWRGAITDGQLRDGMALLGYTETDREVIQAAAVPLPGVQDLITFAVREVFDPAARAALTLDEDFPAAMLEQTRKVGMPDQFARDAWAAHWQLPSPTQLYEMLHRGLIDEAQLAAALKAADYAPAWRAKLQAISYNVLTRVDVRRVADALGKDRAWIVAQNRAAGYSPEDAETLADFTIKQIQKARAGDRRDLTDGLKSTIVSRAVAGSVAEADARRYLAAMGYDAVEITALFDEARAIRAGARAQRISELVGDLYVRGHWTWERAAQELQERGFTADELAQRKREYDLERELRKPLERAEQQRDLTRADLIAAYSAKIITRPETSRRIQKLGYDADETETILDLQDYRDARAERDAQLQVVQRRYVGAKLTEHEATLALDKLGIQADRRNALLEKWELEKKAKTADLPIGTVEALFTRQIWTEAETKAYISQLGYDDRETSGLLRLWGAKGEEKAARDRAAAEKKAAAAARGKATA